MYFIILHFFRSTTSVWCTHNYRPCTVTEACTNNPCEHYHYAYKVAVEPLRMHYNKYHNIAIMGYRVTLSETVFMIWVSHWHFLIS